MSNFNLLFLIIGLGAGYALARWRLADRRLFDIGQKQKLAQAQTRLEAVNVRQQEVIREAEREILKLLAEKSRISNNEVEKMLGVSDATATRYLERLERAGKIAQVGREGRAVHYRLKK